ncbi:MAG: Holliday junction resolvase RuvX [bacterium]
MKILGLDVGDKRIGIAITDELGFMAHSLKVIERKNMADDVLQIKELFKDHQIEKIVIGLPLKLDGSSSIQTEKVKEFISYFEKSFTVPIIAWDERLTTKQAERYLIQMETKKKKQKEIIDKLSAACILQSYLDTLPSKKKFYEEEEGEQDANF